MKTMWLLSTVRRDCQTKVAAARPAAPTAKGSHGEEAHRILTAERPPQLEEGGSGLAPGDDGTCSAARSLRNHLGTSSEVDRYRGPDPAAADGSRFPRARGGSSASTFPARGGDTKRARAAIPRFLMPGRSCRARARQGGGGFARHGGPAAVRYRSGLRR